MLRLSQVTLSNLLSFGPKGECTAVHDLNVLIGPNASGKSNFIDVIGLLQALPSDLSVPVREGGGIYEWLWRGSAQQGGGAAQASIEAVFSDGQVSRVRHRIVLGADGPRVRVVDESVVGVIENYDGRAARHLELSFQAGKITASVDGRVSAPVTVQSLHNDQSVLAQRIAFESLASLSTIRAYYEQIRVYRDWNTARGGPLRSPQPADLPEDFLMPGAENLGVVLNNMQRHPDAWEALNERLSRLHPALKEVKTLVQANTVQIMLREKDLKTLTPATRMSDGTLRYLALLAILLHPAPPSLVCIEEPELGLHPDLIDDLAHLLIDSSKRMQIVVTTHSDHLVNALSSNPSSVLVAERETGGTVLRRLDGDRLAAWLQSYRLGELWMKGEIGGTRW